MRVVLFRIVVKLKKVVAGVPAGLRVVLFRIVVKLIIRQMPSVKV